jgi:hypothetical protein
LRELNVQVVLVVVYSTFVCALSVAARRTILHQHCADYNIVHTAYAAAAASAALTALTPGAQMVIIRKMLDQEGRPNLARLDGINLHLLLMSSR